MKATIKLHDNGSLYLYVSEVTILDLDHILSLLMAFGRSEDDARRECQRILCGEKIKLKAEV